jgi:hypothetical protein
MAVEIAHAAALAEIQISQQKQCKPDSAAKQHLTPERVEVASKHRKRL